MRSIQEEIAELRERFGDEIVDDVSVLPCEYAPKGNPHPPIQEGDFLCDGYGHLVNAERNEVSPNLCRCYLDYRSRKWTGGYCAQLERESRFEVMSARREKYALAKALREWNFKTPAVLLTGPSGTGKTLASHVLALETIERKKVEGVYFSTTRIADEFKRVVMADPDEKALLYRKQLLRMDAADDRAVVIVLDDLGRERQSPAVVEEIAGIIRKVYARRGYLIASTNAPGTTLRQMYGDDIVDRLSDPRWVTPVKCDGENARRNPEPSRRVEVEADRFWDDLGFGGEK